MKVRSCVARILRFSFIQSTWIGENLCIKNGSSDVRWFSDSLRDFGLRIGDTGRAILFQFICSTKKQRIFFFTKICQSYVKSVKESKYLIRISICLMVLELCQKICENGSFHSFPHPWKNKTKQENEAKMKVTMIILESSLYISKFLHIWYL